jgi:CubicO group peptidase (beta-lactamase class C family)
VLVKQGGEVVYKNCFGSSDTDVKLKEDSIFRLASMTKPITGVAIMKQVERGLVSLDDPLDKFIPEYAEMEIGRPSGDDIEIIGRAQGKIKILHLLTHTSGVGCGELGAALSNRFPMKGEYNIADIAKEYSAFPISFEPFTAQAYSGTIGFDLLARVVEITSGMPYNEFVEQEIFKPLGMVDTTFTPSDEQWDRMVRMHDFKDGVCSFHPLKKHIFGNHPLSYFCGGAGLISTVSDYEKFAEMLLCEGKSRDGAEILSPETVRLMRSVAVPDSIMPGNQKWALSMRVILEPTYGRLPVGAYGWSGAYGTHFWVDPENQVVAVYMKNSFYDGGSGALTAANFEKDVYL